MRAKLILMSAAGLASLAAVVALAFQGMAAFRNALNYDPAVVPYSMAEVQSTLFNADVSMPRTDGDGEIRIWSNGIIGNGVDLAMKYDQTEWAQVIECQAIITELAPNKSRVVADCGDTNTNSPIGNTEKEMRKPMFDEFIQSTLHKTPFNRARVTRKETAAAFGNLGGLRREAWERAREGVQRVREVEHLLSR